MRNINHLGIAFLAIGMLSFAACAGKKPAPETETVSTANADVNETGDSDSGKAMGLQTIHFPYDSFALNEEATKMLQANSEILKGKPSVKVQIEGHADQRGGIQYNIALGEKRANAVKMSLEGMGVTADRITTISFGKERPVDNGTTEEAYAKNRRANFVITSR